jgi:hypothetical protein
MPHLVWRRPTTQLTLGAKLTWTWIWFDTGTLGTTWENKIMGIETVEGQEWHWQRCREHGNSISRTWTRTMTRASENYSTMSEKWGVWCCMTLYQNWLLLRSQVRWRRQRCQDERGAREREIREQNWENAGTHGSRSGGTLIRRCRLSIGRDETRQESTQRDEEKVGHGCLAFDEARQEGLYSQKLVNKRTSTSTNLECGK